jgi:hypothetical protein
MDSDNVRHYGEALRIMRERDAEVGTVAVPKRRKCPGCGVYFDIPDFSRIGYTGAVAGALDVVCKSCALVHGKTLAKLCRIVCVGCREVVHIMEPGKERCGFVWEPGACYHVTECPVCSKTQALKKSPVVELILFYKTNKIPYDTRD